MLKRITILVCLVVFAKPVYNVTKDFILPVWNEMKIEEVALLEKSFTPFEENFTSVNDIGEGEPLSTVSTEEQLAQAIYYYVSRFEPNFTITFKGHTAQLEQLINNAYDRILHLDGYVYGHLDDRQISFRYSNDWAKLSISQNYLMSSEQAQQVNEKVAAVISSARLAGATDVEKVKFVNDYIVKNVVYSEQTSASPHSAYAALFEGKAVCQGYALLAEQMLRQLGVTSQYIVGEVYTGGHAWNLVKLDSAWYHLDTTWNDPTPDRGQSVRYLYFLKNDIGMKKDHSWDASNYPEAISTQFEYMHVMQDAYTIGNEIYFSHERDDDKLYKLNMTTKDMQKVSDVRALFISGKGNWLYFSNYSKGAYLSKIQLDGTELTTLYREKVDNVFVEDDYIYFMANGNYQKMRIE